MKRILITLLSLSILFGCASLNKGLDNFNKSLTSLNNNTSKMLSPEPVMVSDSTGKICAEARKNVNRAEKTYVGKGIVFEGVIASNFDTLSSLSNSFMVEKSSALTFFVDKSGIDTDLLNKGQSIKVKGVIESISISYSNDCLISVTNATI